MARPMVQDMFDALMMDLPLRPAMIVDFGIIQNGSGQHSILQSAVRAGATANELDAVIGDGRAISNLVKKYTDYDIEYKTAYDMM
jgi:hypothetical protein